MGCHLTLVLLYFAAYPWFELLFRQLQDSMEQRYCLLYVVMKSRTILPHWLDVMSTRPRSTTTEIEDEVAIFQRAR